MEKHNKGVNPAVLEMSGKILECLKIDGRNGAITAEENTFEKTLPEDLTMDIVNKVSDHNTTFVAAGVHAMGQMAIESMGQHKNLDSASGTIKMGGKDTLEVGIDRSRTYANRLQEGATDVVKYGVTDIDYTVVAGKNAGQLKKVKQAIGEYAHEHLKG